MYESILLPFDGSDRAASVLQHASELATWTDGTIHVLYVADTTEESVAAVDSEVIETLVRDGEDIVGEAATALDALGADYETDVVEGNPAPSITEYAETNDHDLIVMPTHAREGLSRNLVGSVTEKVVRLASVPVLTARMKPDEKLQFPYEAILLPVDGSDEAFHAAKHGLALAGAVGADVHVLSAIDETAVETDIRSTIAEKTEQAAHDAIDEVVAEAESVGVEEPVTHVEHASPDEAIREYVDANGIQAVVMGATGMTGTEQILLGSVAEKAVRSVPVPVMTVKQSEP